MRVERAGWHWVRGRPLVTAATTRSQAGFSILRPLMDASIVYPVLRTISVALLIFIVIVSLVDDPSGATGSGGIIADFISRLVFGSPAYGDKVAHFAAYAVLSFVTVLGFGRHRRSAAMVLFALLMLGGGLELLQAAGGVRTGDALDMVANTLGIMVGGGTGAVLRLAVRRFSLSPV